MENAMHPTNILSLPRKTETTNRIAKSHVDRIRRARDRRALGLVDDNFVNASPQSSLAQLKKKRTRQRTAFNTGPKRGESAVREDVGERRPRRSIQRVRVDPQSDSSKPSSDAFRSINSAFQKRNAVVASSNAPVAPWTLDESDADADAEVARLLAGCDSLEDCVAFSRFH